MDVNLVFECIGYGASRAVASENFAARPSQIPARYIMETTRDPVAYCIEAYARWFPDTADKFDAALKALILRRLQREAGVTRH